VAEEPELQHWLRWSLSSTANPAGASTLAANSTSTLTPRKRDALEAVASAIAGVGQMTAQKPAGSPLSHPGGHRHTETFYLMRCRPAVPTPPSAARVLVIDWDRRVRAALGQLLASEPGLTLCGEAACAASALSQLAAAPPDIVLIDPLLPTAADGTQVVRAAAEAGTRVVVLTADRSLRTSARRLGAAALDKDGDHEQLLATLRGPRRAER
jgi:CheY-like chemotaxis protein